MTEDKISSKISIKGVWRKILKKIIFFIFFIPFFLFGLSYDVKFEGLKDKEALLSLQNVSNLVLLKKMAPKTINALRYRALNDKDNIIKLLNAFGYYDAIAEIDIEEKNKKIIVYVYITSRTRYKIKDVSFFDFKNPKIPTSFCNITREMIGLKNRAFARSDLILNSQNRLLYELSSCGYPFAKMINRNIIIDKAEKIVNIEFYVDQSYFCKFGQVTISGLKTIDKNYIEKKITWREGQKYNETQVLETQKKLLATNLFSSVSITHPQMPDNSELLSVDIQLVEALHKYFSFGGSYATIDGFGGSLEWYNRNFRSLGEEISLNLSVAQRAYLATAIYKKSDFMVVNQDLVWQLEASREKIPYVYITFNYFILDRLDRKFSQRLKGSLGFKAEYVDVTSSANNGKFFLLSSPGFLKYSTTNNLLNPTQGINLIYNIQPFVNMINAKKPFLKQTLVFEFYLPFDESRVFIIAVRSTVGSIMGPSIYRIPLSELFLGGSDDDLRGYRYRTVSPLNSNNKPIGGRSCIYFSIEPRFRVTSKIGFVPFLDIGNVSLHQYPDVKEKWIKGVGAGLRYFTFFGPLRLDIGFPLNRRKTLDKTYRIYASIGQTF